MVSWTISPEARDIVRVLARRLKSTESDAADLALLVSSLVLPLGDDAPVGRGDGEEVRGSVHRPEPEETAQEAEQVSP